MKLASFTITNLITSQPFVPSQPPPINQTTPILTSVQASFTFDNPDEALEFSQFLLSKIATFGKPEIDYPELMNKEYKNG